MRHSNVEMFEILDAGVCIKVGKTLNIISINHLAVIKVPYMRGLREGNFDQVWDQ